MGTLNFQPLSLVYVDAQIIIYSIEKFPNYFPTLESMWLKLKAGEIRLVTSELTLLETLVMPLRQADVTLVQTYEQLLNPVAQASSLRGPQQPRDRIPARGCSELMTVSASTNPEACLTTRRLTRTG